jgi:hypothetical protein
VRSGKAAEAGVPRRTPEPRSGSAVARRPRRTDES